MFENYTFDNLMESCLSRVSNDVDKREGSIIYDALAPAVLELANAYVNLDIILDESFAETASREYLKLRAKERGLEPYAATNAILKGRFNCEIEIGSRFNLESLNYTAIEFIEDVEGEGYYYKLKCETAGETGNKFFGKATPIEYIQGLSSAEILSVISYGEDEEDTEVFRRRYFDSLNMQAFGGNIADYKRIMRGLEGVGQCRIYNADEWNGGGTVKIVFATPQNTKAAAELINQLQEAIDPVAYKGKGSGFAPVGHIVTVATVKEQKINVKLKVKLDTGYTAEIVKPLIENAVKKHFDSVNSTWESSFDHTGSGLKIVVVKVASEISNIQGVINIPEIFIDDAPNGSILELSDKDNFAVLDTLMLEVVS